MPRTKLYILKIGGKVLEDKHRLADLLATFVKIEGPKILVHGGGKRADQLCEALGIQPRMLNGRRITDEATLEVVTMVYAGLINKKIVADLQALDCNAIGFSGADGNAILAHKRIVKNIDYGFAGDIDAVNNDHLGKFLGMELTPVFCAITHNGKGQLLNTNADTIAATLAMAMANQFEVSLAYCFEKPGVLLDPDDDHSVIAQIGPEEFEGHKTTGVISAGMIPKLDNAFRALNKGVERVIIGNIDTLKSGKGTVLKR